MKFSIIIPAYNNEKTILETIGSVLKQDFEDFELVVVDDGSTDKTAEIIREIKDKRVKLFEKKNGGPAAARNFGVRKARGEYVMFLDGDDSLTPGILGKLAEWTTGRDVVLVKSVYKMRSGEIIDECEREAFDFDALQRKMLIRGICNKFVGYNDIMGFDAPGGKAIRRTLLAQNGITFPEGIRRYEDAIFCARVYRAAEKISFRDEIGYVYTYNAESITHKLNPKIYEETYAALEILKAETENQQDFCIKCITNLSVCESVYLFHERAKLSRKEQRAILEKYLETEIYQEMLKKADKKAMPKAYVLMYNMLEGGKLGKYLFLKEMRFKIRMKRGVVK